MGVAAATVTDDPANSADEAPTDPVTSLSSETSLTSEAGTKSKAEKKKDGSVDVQEEQAQIDSAVSLTDEERDLMEQLKSEGFPTWTKRDFNAFIRGCEKYGRDRLDEIAREVETKTAEEVAFIWFQLLLPRIA